MAMQETETFDANVLNDGNSGKKWRGSVRATIQTPASTIWEVVRDFCGLHKWASSIEICELIEGEANSPGCERYCRGKPRRGASTALGCTGGGETAIFWVKEKLLAVDDESRTQTYAVVDGNLVVRGFIGTIRVCERAGDCGAVEWEFELDPVAGSDEEEVVNLLSDLQAAKLESLKKFLNNLEEAKMKSLAE